MLANTFSHGMIRNYVVGFGTLFNNIKINRRAASGESSDTIAVPLAYAPRQRFVERITEDYSLDKPVAISLPRMSFELMSMTYSSERKLNTMQRYKRPVVSSNTKINSVYSPVPYDFTFQLNIFINNIEDGTHIVEQILPYFTPEFTLSLKGATDLTIPMDLPIILNSVSMEDSYEGGFDERRIIIWTMDFTLKGNLYGPISNQGIINKTFVNIAPSMNTAIALTANNSERIISQATQFANGDVTNTTVLSVVASDVHADSDFGISQDIFNMGNDPSNFRIWDFRYPRYGTVQFGVAAGNTTIDGWEPREFRANGTVGLSAHQGVMRHTIVKDNAGSPVTDTQEHTILQIFANTAGFMFEPFYGKNYQKVELTYTTAQLVGTGALISPQAEIRWMSTLAGENLLFDDGDTPGSTPRFHVTSAVGHPDQNSLVSEAGNTYTYTWDMSTKADWKDRIVTAIQFDLHIIEDTSGESTVITDIHSIKITT